MNIRVPFRRRIGRALGWLKPLEQGFDVKITAGLHDQLLDLWAESKPTILIVTHDVGEAVTLADRVVVMRPRPGRLDETLSIAMPRPRDPVSPRYEEAVRRVMAVLDRSLHPATPRPNPAPEMRTEWW